MRSFIHFIIMNIFTFFIGCILASSGIALFSSKGVALLILIVALQLNSYVEGYYENY